jgi:hypothetical protein
MGYTAVLYTGSMMLLEASTPRPIKLQDLNYHSPLIGLRVWSRTFRKTSRFLTIFVKKIQLRFQRNGFQKFPCIFTISQKHKNRLNVVVFGAKP